MTLLKRFPEEDEEDIADDTEGKREWIGDLILTVILAVSLLGVLFLVFN